jgi:hypothetical protein
MNTINLIAIPFVLLLAWAKGRGLFGWAVMAYLFGFWSFVPLFMVKIKPIQIYEIPEPIKQFVSKNSSSFSTNSLNQQFDSPK